MIAKISPFTLSGTLDAPPSKSMAHRYLIGSALSRQKCTLIGVDYSEDILASIDCLKALGVSVSTEGSAVTLCSKGFSCEDGTTLNCRESGSTLRFLIPICLCLGKTITLTGSSRLFERPLGAYEQLCAKYGFRFEKTENSVTLCGKLQSGDYKISGEKSSQFITGLIFALVYLGGKSTIEVIPPFESRPYIDLTLSSLSSFGAEVEFESEYKIKVNPATLRSFTGKIEGDYSNSAFLDAFNCLGSSVKITNLAPDSLQGDKVYKEYFKAIESGTPTLDISNCPDLGPVLIALASLKNGATFTGTARLKAKESDRGEAMKKELTKLGGRMVLSESEIVVEKNELAFGGVALSGHNDHRIVMALAVILSKTGGIIEGAEAIKKSYPQFFEDIKRLGAKVELL